MNLLQRMISGSLAAVVLAVVPLSNSMAGPNTLLESAKAGGVVRIGFSNEPPWAYPGENNKPLGFVHAIVLGTLKSMGITNIEPVVAEWAGLIPGLKANRYDLVTGGMYITGERCKNMDFSNPIGFFGDLLVVPKGNPKNLHNYEDVVKTGSVLATGAGYNTIPVALEAGVTDDKLMLVPGPPEMLAALLSGRADAIVTNSPGGQHLVDKSDGKAEMTALSKMPEHTTGWVGIGFRPGDSGFREAYNVAQAKYIGTDAMLAAAAEYGYSKANLPGDVDTAFACANR